MAYAAEKGTVATVLHAVRDVAGDPVSGQAAGIVRTLRDPDMAVSSLTVSADEIGTTGYYSVSFAPNRTGVWQLSLRNPPGTDGFTTDYPITVTAVELVRP